MLHGIHAKLIYSRTRYDVMSDFRSEVIAIKTAKNTASDGFGSKSLRTV